MLLKHWILFRIQSMKDGINSLSSNEKAFKQRPTGPHIHQQKLRTRYSIRNFISTIIFFIAYCLEFASADQGKYVKFQI